MKLGFHTYGFYLHGIGQLWGGFQLPWPRQMDLWQLMSHCADIELDLEGDPNSMEKSLDIEKTALVRSVNFCRNVLGVGKAANASE